MPKIQYERRDPCGIDNCKETKFYYQDGYWFCKRSGHQQEARDTQAGDEEYGTGGRKIRRKKDRPDKISQTYRSHSATQLFLQCHQLILWKQSHALVHTIGLPPELEIVIRDLWGLRLRLLEGKVDATSGEDTVFSSQPQSSEAETETERGGGGREWKVRGKMMPTLIETLGVCYLGMMVLRLPVSMGEVYRWAVREEIVYIRAIRHVPAVMKQKLPAEYFVALDTTSLLEPDHLRKSIHNLCLLYKHHFDLTIPSANAPLLLFKHIRDLALPINIFPAVRGIASLLSIDFAFPTPGHRQRLSSLPEILLISLIVIVVKTYYPFDSLDRSAQSTKDPAALTFSWNFWTDAQRAHGSRLTEEGHLTPGSASSVTEKDAMKMSVEELDDYLDWYGRTWVNDERMEKKARGLPKQLLDMFPTGRLDGSLPTVYDYGKETAREQQSTQQKIVETISQMKMRDVVPEEDEDDPNVKRVGTFYKRYRKGDDLNQPAQAFHAAAARSVGISLESLLVAVLQTERRLVVWREEQLKAKKGGTEKLIDRDAGEDEMEVDGASSGKS